MAREPFELLALAARGDVSAQRSLANRAAELACDPESGCDPLVALVEGLVLARMAASQGAIQDHGLCLSLAALLVALEGEDRCPDLMAEAIARASLVADAGDENAARFLPSLLQGVPPAVVIMAKEFEQRLKGKS